MGHVGKEDVDFHDFLNTRTSSCENSLQVLDASGSLLLDGTLNQVTLDITGDLARAVDGSWGLDGVRLDEIHAAVRISPCSFFSSKWIERHQARERSHT